MAIPASTWRATRSNRPKARRASRTRPHRELALRPEARSLDSVSDRLTQAWYALRAADNRCQRKAQTDPTPSR